MEKIWLSHYPEGVPAEIKAHRHQSLVEMFEKCCSKFGKKSALSHLGKRLTFSQLDVLSRDLAAFFQRCNLTKGERVAIMLPNLLQYPVALFGILRAGLVVVNVNPMYTAPELVKQLNDSGAKSIIVLSNFAHVLQHALPETHVKNVIVTEVGDLLGKAKSHVVNFILNKVKKSIPEWFIPYSISFKKALSIGQKAEFNRVAVNEDDIAFLQYTGGTTGISKAAILTHYNMVANIEQIGTWVGLNLDEGNEICVTALPMYHIFSLACSLAFLKNGTMGILITNPRDIHAFAKQIGKYKFTIFVGLTSLYNALLHNDRFKKLNFNSLKLCVAGGMALQSAVVAKWEKLTGCTILEGYGLTEASPLVTMNPLDITNFTGSVGLPAPSTMVSIRDDHGNEKGIGEEGEVWVRGPQVMRGYWQREEETTNVLTADGWLKTGDIGLMDERGFLYLVDRKKDMILVSGFNVYPAEIEEVIMTHPDVKEVAVIGVPSKHMGEVVKAFIVRKDDSLTKEKMVAFCKDRMISYKVPKRIEFRDELPKSNVGKILRRALRAEN